VHKIVNPLERDDAGADAQLWIDGEENILFSGSHCDGQPEESRLEPQRLFQTEEFCHCSPDSSALKCLGMTPTAKVKHAGEGARTETRSAREEKASPSLRSG